MKARTKSLEGKWMEVELIGDYDAIGMIRCKLSNGNIILRHKARLEVITEEPVQEVVNASIN